MARLNLDKEGLAYFDLILSSNSDGCVANALLKIPKGYGRSGLVLYETFLLGSGLQGCCDIVGFVDKSVKCAKLKNDSTCFLLTRRCKKQVSFEVRRMAGDGEVIFRTVLDESDVNSFINRLASVSPCSTA